MANIRALAKGLLAGRGRGRSKSRIGGWVRVDPDHVIRGWAWDGADPGRRLTVRLFIDLKPVAEILADRFDPKLAEQGQGDGRYAFAYLIPQAFRDDREHQFEAVVEEAGYRLLSKDKSFTIEASTSAPRLSLLEVGSNGLRARLRGARAVDAELELWSGGRRIEGLASSRSGAGPQAELHLSWPHDLELGDDAVVALAGMVEAGAGFARLPAASACAEPAAEADGANLVRNAELNDWPHGVIVRGGPGRFELALGWHAQNRKSPGTVRAYPTPLDFEGEGCCLTLAAPKVGEYLRLEAELENRALAGRTLDLSFEAAIAQGPTGAFQSPEPFLLIDRVFLKPAEGRGGSVTMARNVVLTRRMRRFAFRVEAPADLGGPALLAFDFKRPVAVTLQRPSLTITPAGAPEPSWPLTFEDAGLEAQVALVEGLEPWASQEVLQPPAASGASPGAVAPERAHPLGSIEVVVCVHDAADEALACLASLAACTPLLHRVRIIDDASSEDTVARLSGFIADKPWMELDRNPGHLGYTVSANRGIRSSAADWVVLLNSDTVVTPGWLEGLLDAAASQDRVAMAGPLSNAASWQSVPELHDRSGKFKTNEPPPGWDPVRIAELISARSERAFPEVPLLNGFCTLIRREAFMALGGFNEAAFPMGYGEENDLCLRMAEAGWKLVVADNVYVHHAKSASFGAERRAALQAEGMAALKRLHPGVDFAALGERMRETFALIRMRNTLRAAWKGQPA